MVLNPFSDAVDEDLEAGSSGSEDDEDLER